MSIIYDVIIKDGLLIDGTGTSPVHGSVGIKDDKIVFVGILFLYLFIFLLIVIFIDIFILILIFIVVLLFYYIFHFVYIYY